VRPASDRVLSVIIPAHDEEARLPGLLRALDADGLELVVVANGCTDRTADAARRACPRAIVVEIDKASKTAALRAGDAVAHHFPRFYLDADIDVARDDLLHLAGLLRGTGLLAVAPSVVFDSTGCTRVVQAFYRALPLLAQVKGSIAGTGCMGLTQEGRLRFDAWPDVLADDFFLDGLFSPAEKERAPGATAIVRTPVDARDLLNRRERVVWTNWQVRSLGLRAHGHNGGSAVLSAALRHPERALDFGVFALVAVVVRIRVRIRRLLRQQVGWNRDASRSRGL
jgi:glycosyltransferase involved in cell wall biosynthesis